MQDHLNRRQVLRQASVAGMGLLAGGLATRAAARPLSPNDKLNIACIGVGGRGGANTKAMAGENVVALCDVDRLRLEAMAKQFPEARLYRDYRKLLDEEKALDAVVVSTPDHHHVWPSVTAMNRGLHVYCEKPLTHSVAEARLLADTVRRTKVITQMGTGGQSGAAFWRTVAAIRAGVIGQVQEVHHWTNRPIWPQGQERLAGEDPVPAHLDWDLWIGPAPMRPYKDKYPDGPFQGKPVYHPFVWRGWFDFGTGALGDIAPHAINVTFRALDLGAPKAVEAECSGTKGDSFPSWSIVRFEFPATGQRPAVKLIWYDGGKRPAGELLGIQEVPDSGTLFVGTKGMLYNSTLLPSADFKDFQWPEAREPYPDVHVDWIESVKAGRATGCNFEYSAPMTEAYLLGNIALRVGQRIEWDPAAFKITNCPAANQYLKREYRKGWEVG